MQVRLFGELEAEQAGMPVPVHGAKQRALLALLALRAGQPVSADRLIDVLWGDGQAAHPGNALQAQVGQLRRTFGAAAVITTDAGYALDAGSRDVDAARFEQLVAKGRRLFEEGEIALASTALGEALRLRRGEPLTEFAYSGFADAERARLEELLLVAIETRVEADLVLGRHGEARRRTGGVVPGASASRAAVGAAHARPVPGRPPGRGLARLHRCSSPVWSTSWELTPGPPCANSRPASWPRTHHSAQRARQVSRRFRSRWPRATCGSD